MKRALEFARIERHAFSPLLRTFWVSFTLVIPFFLMPELHFIIGPTAVGKTELSLRWAEAHGAEILYCDAFCVYKGMDIGTAKPDAAEQARVPHHGIDLVDAGTAYTIGDYVAYSRGVVEDCAARGVPLLISGGSGFYTKSFFSAVVDDTEPDDSVRTRVRAMSEESALSLLSNLNPDGIEGVDLRNPRRVQSALERCLSSGQSLRALQERYRAMPVPFEGWGKKICLLARDRAQLNERIEKRARIMVENGLIEEVVKLREQGFDRNPSASSAIGYRETLAWLDAGANDTEALALEIAANTRKLVKKQLSFFRNQLPSANIVDLTNIDSPDIEALF